MKQAAIASDDIAVRLAALFHDLGKAKTPVDKLPAHHGHELAGVDIIDSINSRLHLHKELVKVSKLVAEYHLLMHNWYTLTATRKLKLLADLDVYRKPRRILQFALSCWADATGRTGLENRVYTQKDDFIAFATHIVNLDLSKIKTNTGMSVDLKLSRMHEARMSAAKQFCKK